MHHDGPKVYPWYLPWIESTVVREHLHLLPLTPQKAVDRASLWLSFNSLIPALVAEDPQWIGGCRYGDIRKVQVIEVWVYLHGWIMVVSKKNAIQYQNYQWGSARNFSINCLDAFSLWLFKRRIWLLALIFCAHWVAVKGCAPPKISCVRRSNSELLRSDQKLKAAVAAQVLWSGNHDLRHLWFGISIQN